MTMRDDLSKDLLPGRGEGIDPVELARRDLIKALPKRFYKQAGIGAVEGGFALLLDGRSAKTPARHALCLPTEAAALSLAEEWNAQEEVINPLSMPLTRIVNSAIDGVADTMDEVAAEIVKYAGTDHVLYRATDPTNLVELQKKQWDPVVDFARDSLGAEFRVTQGIVHVQQPQEALDAVAKAVDIYVNSGAKAPFLLATLHVMTTLSGSALLALAVARRHYTVEQAWELAHVDEDYQIRGWGTDDEALARRARRWREMDSAAKLFFEINGVDE